MATPAAAKIIDQALALTDEERAAVAEELLASLDPTHADDSPEAAAAFVLRATNVSFRELMFA